MRTIVAITLAAGCSFRLPSPANGGDDGDPNGGELPGEAGGCGWPYAPEYYDPCALGTAGPALDLTITGQYVYDTVTGVLTDPLLVPSTPPSTDGPVRQLYAAEFSIGENSKLRIVGAKPVLVISDTTIAIGGVIDASSFFDGLVFQLGAGANPPECPASPPELGQTCVQEGASGGGGAGYGSAGGDGGEGGNTHDCGGTDGKPGGAGGEPATSFTALRGGCAGRDGAPSTQPGSDLKVGVGAPGGGAFELSARTMITVSGVAHAGGAGGRGSLGGRAGGGGGGTGGMIGLEGETVIVTSAGIVAANGGGGGGGADGGIASPGDDAKPGAAVAKGGKRDGAGSDGGDGGSVMTLDGQPGGTASRGGGGGGGGVGVVHFHYRGLNVTGATISPAPTP